MLVLSRRVGEGIVIGDDIVITVLEVRGDVVRVGVDAPRAVQVRRRELLTQLEESNRAAASPGAGAIADLSRLVATDKQARPKDTQDRPADRQDRPADLPPPGRSGGAPPGSARPGPPGPRLP